MRTDVQDLTGSGSAVTGSPLGPVNVASSLAVQPSAHVPRLGQSSDLGAVLDDVVHLVRCLVELDETDATDRWRRETMSFEALAKARRSLHQCARNRGMA